MKETHDFSDAKVGDLVTCLMFGKGVVTSLLPKGLAVQFGTVANCLFDNKGRHQKDVMLTLYHGHVEFEIKVLEQVQPVYEWQWLMKRKSDSEQFETTAFHKNEGEIEILWAEKFWTIHSRIEESKREVKS